MPSIIKCFCTSVDNEHENQADNQSQFLHKFTFLQTDNIKST